MNNTLSLSFSQTETIFFLGRHPYLGTSQGNIKIKINVYSDFKRKHYVQ